MKVKEFKQWLQDKNDEDIIIFSEYSAGSEAFTCEVSVKPRLKRPKRTDFEHKDCKYCEPVEIKGENRLYCNRICDIIDRYDDESCDCFQHKSKDVDFCLECRFCYAHYPNGCKGIYKK